MRSPWSVIDGPGPLVAVALHDGHELRPEVAALTAVDEADRLREEDPFTGPWTAMVPARVVVHRSRFEVDFNRPRHQAVYRRPEDAWGLCPWRGEPPATLLERSLALHDAFYAELRRLLDATAAREGRFVLFDLHSYNHRRGGPLAPPDDPSLNPEIDLCTMTMPRVRWAPVVERVGAALRAAVVDGRQLDVRENVKFGGGERARWVHATYPETGCAVVLEFKKIFVDEWTGALCSGLHASLGALLGAVAAAVTEQLRAAPP